ncbi:MAG: ATP-binding protein, partial [Candidatus Pacearchaeota archaeon]
SDGALIGGGSIPKPGEITLAHRGVLFLDELPEFARRALETLRTVIEERRVVISRAQRTATFPANFQLISAMNPCPCGNFKNPKKECRCSPSQIKKYISKISGPLLDRFDIFLEVPSLEAEEILSVRKTDSLDQMKKAKEHVMLAHQIQESRYKHYSFSFNSEIPVKLQTEFLKLDNESEEILKSAIKKYSLSARAVFRILKVARTIADIEFSDKIKPPHILESISLRKAESFFYQDVIHF